MKYIPIEGLLTRNKSLFEYFNNLKRRGVDPVSREEEIWEKFGETKCILVMDTVGFTRITSEQGIVYFLSKLLLIREAVLPIIAKHGGEEINPYADNVYAFFKNPKDGLKTAIEANREIKNRQIMLTPKEPCQISCGIGFGRLLRSSKDDGYYGDEMNMAFKLGEDIAAGGEILITSSTFEAIPKRYQKPFEKKNTAISGTVIQYFRMFCHE